MAAEGWGEKEICNKGVVDCQNKERCGGRGVFLPFPCPVTQLSTLTPNQRSNMADQIKDCKLIMLACPNKTPALKVKATSD